MLGYVPDMPHATARKRAAVAFLAETAPDQGASVSEGSLTLRRQLVLVVLAARFDLALAPRFRSAKPVDIGLASR